MKLLFDCDVIIDIWGKTEDFFESYSSFDTALTREFKLCMVSNSVVSINYILAARKYLDRKTARNTIGVLLNIFEVIDTCASDCRKAFESEMGDYEDALSAFAAQRSNIDFIITRNKRDFHNSPVPALTPREFLEIYKPDYLKYEMTDP